MPFVITMHANDRILEVVYPVQPTVQDVNDYARASRAAIGKIRGRWACLVDQRQLALMPPDVVGVMAELNAFAQGHGMICSARLMTSKLAELQASRLAREATLKVPMRTFSDRDPALQWLRSMLDGPP